jgi:hypothetical protein
MKPMVLALLMVAALMTSAQTPKPGPMTDSEKIAEVLRAGPRFIANDATLLDWPSTPNGEYRILHKGTNDRVCLPGSPRLPHDEPRRHCCPASSGRGPRCRSTFINSA